MAAVSDQDKATATVSLLLALLAGQKSRLLAAVTLVSVSALLDLWVYYLLYRAAQLALTQTYPSGALWSLAGYLALTLIAKYLLLTLGGYLSHIAAFRVLYETRLRLAYALAKLPLSVLGRYSSGGLRKIILGDVEKLESFIAHNTIELVSALLAPGVAAMFLLWLDWRMALAALCTIPLALLVQMLLSRGMNQAVQDYQQATEQLNGATVEYLRGIPVIKAFLQTSDSFRLLHQRLEAYHQLVLGFTRRAVPGWSAFVVLLTANIFVLLPVGMGLYFQGSLSLAVFILSVMLGSGLLKPLLKLLHVFSSSREVLISARRIYPLLRPQDECLPELLPAGQMLQLQDVHFCYQTRPIIQGVSLELLPGEFYALVGASGSGKSTLAALLSGLLPVLKGEIYFGGVPLSRLTDSQRVQAIALVSQESFLFQGTLAQNLRLANPQASQRQLLQALEVAQAKVLVESLPEGLDTQVGERGIRLSGGERQRIAIARALLAQSAVLVLDEATAFADSITECRFYQALRRHYPATTLLVIAHRLYSVQHARRIIVLEQGSVSAAGSHQQLLAENPGYQALWYSQFQAQTWHIRQPPDQTAMEALC